MSGFGGEAEILCSTRALPVLTHSGPQPSQNPALQRGAQRAPEWHLAVRPSARDAPSPAAPLVPDFQGGYTVRSVDIVERFCRGLTAPNGGIRSASSIGTIVHSSAVVVGQRSERGVP